MKLTALKTSELVAEPNGGSSFVKCALEAAWLALENNIQVSFVFNEKRYRVDTTSIIGCVKPEVFTPKKTEEPVPKAEEPVPKETQPAFVPPHTFIPNLNTKPPPWLAPNPPGNL